ncbi:MAG: allophanate hydrolase subunit 1 [Algoriphagus sp.]|nr:allophanate hydrolase subunit 1 [Algoriphagus sp.]
MIPGYRLITPNLGEFFWNEAISDELLRFQLAIKNQVLEDFGDTIQETRIGFQTLSIVWKTAIPASELNSWLESMPKILMLKSLSEDCWKVPVRYSSSTGRDLETLAESKNISVADLISLHSSVEYRIHFFGFLPGFMYLNGLPEKLNTPRKRIPDLSVPAGSVAIGGSQTGIYPSESPGGWHLIGRSPIRLFDPQLIPAVWAEPGEKLLFTPISEKEFDLLIRQPKLPELR